VDRVSRDYAVADLIALEQQSEDIGPVRMLFRQNRAISSITADLDQKSIWEVLSRISGRCYPTHGSHNLPY
jgi:hypothetical protein